MISLFAHYTVINNTAIYQENNSEVIPKLGIPTDSSINTINKYSSSYKELTTLNTTEAVDKYLNITISLVQPFNILINSKLFVDLKQMAINYTLSIDSMTNLTLSNKNNFSASWIIDTLSYSDGMHSLLINIQFINNTWINYPFNLIFDNSGPKIVKLDFPWENSYPNVPFNLTLQLEDPAKIIEVQIVIRELENNSIITNSTYFNPIDDIIMTVPGLPIGFNGYIQIYSVDELGNSLYSPNYNFKVRALDINNVLIKSNVNQNNPINNLFTLFQGNIFTILYNFTNYIKVSAYETYLVNVSINDKINFTSLYSFGSQVENYSINYYLGINGLSGYQKLILSWYYIPINKSLNVTPLVFEKEINIFVLPDPSNFAFLDNYPILISIFSLIIGPYAFYYRFYGKLKYKEQRGKILNKRSIVFLGFAIGYIVFVASIPILPILSYILIPFFWNYIFPESLFYLFLMVILSLTIGIGYFIIAKELFWNFSLIEKDKKVTFPFEFSISLSIISVFLIKFCFDLFFDKITSLSIKSTDHLILFDFIPFLSVIYLLFYIRMHIRNWLLKKQVSKLFINTLDLTIIIIGISLILFLYIWFFPYINLFSVLAFIGTCSGLIVQAINQLIIFQNTKEWPQNEELINLKHDTRRPHFYEMMLKCEFYQPQRSKLTASWSYDDNLKVNTINKIKSNINYKGFIEFGVYKLEMHIKLSYIGFIFNNKYYKTLVISPVIDDIIVTKFFTSLGMSIRKISNFGLIMYFNIQSRKIYQIISISEKKYERYQNAIIYIINQPPTFDVLRDYYNLITESWAKNKEYAFIIIPMLMDISASLQRSLYQWEEKLSIIPIVYQEIDKRLSFRDFKTECENLFSKAIDEYSEKENLFDFSKPIEEPSQFFGRDGIISKILNDYRKRQPFAIFGFYRIGKSSIIKQLIRRLELNTIAIYIDASGIQNFNELMENIWFELKEMIPRKLNGFTYVDSDLISHNTLLSFKKLFTFLIKYLHENDSNENDSNENVTQFNILLIIDEMTGFMKNLSSEEEKIRLLGIIRALIEEFTFFNVCLVFHNDQYTNDAKYRIFQLFREYWIIGLDEDISKQMILELSERMHIEFPDDLSGKITHYYGGYPFLIRKMCSLIINKYNTKKIPNLSDQEFNELVKDEDFQRIENGTFQSIWNEQISDEEKKLLYNLVKNSQITENFQDLKKLINSLSLKGVLENNEIKPIALKEWIRNNFVDGG